MYQSLQGMSRRNRIISISLIALIVIGLAIDAYVHLHLASIFDPIRTKWVSQGDMFRIEAGLAIVAAVAVALRPRRYTAAFAFVVAAGGVFAVLLYQYVNVGQIGPLPDMYDPLWSTEKVASLIGEAVAALAAGTLLAFLHHSIRRSGQRTASSSTPAPVAG